MNNANLTENAAKITDLSEKVIPQYLALWLQAPICQMEILQSIKSAAQGKLALSRINKLSVYIPPLEQQQEIVSKINSLFNELKTLEMRYNYLCDRKIGFPYVGKKDNTKFSKDVEKVVDGFKLYDSLISSLNNDYSKEINLIQEKIIKSNQIKFFDEYIDRLPIADVEDMFEVDEYLKIFNEEFKDEYREILKNEIDTTKSILPQINNLLNIKRFNHYRPSKYLTSLCVECDYFSKDTLDRFENLFKDINKLLK